jgi:8-oxo-dGTP diphosphatase
MYPTKAPRLACAVIMKKDDKILLGVRGREPNKGKWVLPGGGVNFLEPLQSALRREVHEETGLEISIQNIMGVYEIITPPDEHRVIVYWWAIYQAGDLNPSSDILEAKFFSREEVRSLIAAGETSQIVSKVLKDIGWA